MQAAPFKGAARAGVGRGGDRSGRGRLHFTEQPNKTFADGIELSLFALDERGRQHGGSFYQFNLALRPDTYERVRGSIVRMNPRMALPPGRYQLRVGVRETGAGEMGSVFYDLQVPDYSARGLAMSGLLLTDEAARQQFSPQPDDELPPGALPAPATSRRTFSQNDILSVFAEIYDNGSSRDARRIEVTTTLGGRRWECGVLVARVAAPARRRRREELADSSREADSAERRAARTLRAARRSAAARRRREAGRRAKRRSR